MKTHESEMPDESTWADFFDTEAILRKLGLSPSCGDVVDFGCGYGTFTIPAARMISGTVHALDIKPEMIQATEAKAASGGADEHQDAPAPFRGRGLRLAAGKRRVRDALQHPPRRTT